MQTLLLDTFTAADGTDITTYDPKYYLAAGSYAKIYSNKTSITATIVERLTNTTGEFQLSIDTSLDDKANHYSNPRIRIGVYDAIGTSPGHQVEVSVWKDGFDLTGFGRTIFTSWGTTTGTHTFKIYCSAARSVEVYIDSTRKHQETMSTLGNIKKISIYGAGTAVVGDNFKWEGTPYGIGPFPTFLP